MVRGLGCNAQSLNIIKFHNKRGNLYLDHRRILNKIRVGLKILISVKNYKKIINVYLLFQMSRGQSTTVLCVTVR